MLVGTADWYKSQSLTALVVGRAGQALRQHICRHVLSWHVAQVYELILQSSTDEMVSNVDMFRPGVEDWVPGQLVGTLVVVVHNDRSLF